MLSCLYHLKSSSDFFTFGNTDIGDGALIFHMSKLQGGHLFEVEPLVHRPDLCRHPSSPLSFSHSYPFILLLFFSILQENSEDFRWNFSDFLFICLTAMRQDFILRISGLSLNIAFFGAYWIVEVGYTVYSTFAVLVSLQKVVVEVNRKIS